MRLQNFYLILLFFKLLKKQINICSNDSFLSHPFRFSKPPIVAVDPRKSFGLTWSLASLLSMPVCRIAATGTDLRSARRVAELGPFGSRRVDNAENFIVKKDMLFSKPPISAVDSRNCVAVTGMGLTAHPLGRMGWITRLFWPIFNHSSNLSFLTIFFSSKNVC